MTVKLPRGARPIGIGAIALIVEYLLLGTQQFANALTLGAIYALIALGYTMVYGIVELINFAHGDVFMVGSFLAMWIMTTIFGLTGPVTNLLNLVGLLAIVMLATMVGMGLIGMFIERVAYRPLRHAPRLAPLITAIGVSFILQNIIATAFGPSPVNFPQIVPADKFALMGGKIAYLNVFIVILAVVLMIALQLFVGPDAAGPGDALDGPGSRGRRADGRRHQPDDRDHVLHRGRPGRGGRHGPGPVCRQHQVRPGLLRRPEGLHGRRPRRHRQHDRARRSAASSSPSSRSTPRCSATPSGRRWPSSPS